MMCGSGSGCRFSFFLGLFMISIFCSIVDVSLNSPGVSADVQSTTTLTKAARKAIMPHVCILSGRVGEQICGGSRDGEDAGRERYERFNMRSGLGGRASRKNGGGNLAATRPRSVL